MTVAKEGPGSGAQGRDADSPAPRFATYVVDRREGDIVILENDAGSTMDVEAALLPRSCRAEGTVVRLPLDRDGTPRWAEAVRDREEERRRRAELSRRVARLRESDPGGDVEL